MAWTLTYAVYKIIITQEFLHNQPELNHVFIIKDYKKNETPNQTNCHVRDETPYRYMTEVYYPDMETFNKSFFDPNYQVELAKSLERIADPLFLISEEVISEVVLQE
jgi:hypothetical protein